MNSYPQQNLQETDVTVSVKKGDFYAFKTEKTFKHTVEGRKERYKRNQFSTETGITIKMYLSSASRVLSRAEAEKKQFATKMKIQI